MKKDPVFDCIDRQFLKAIDKINSALTLKKKKKARDSGIGEIIFPGDPYIIKRVRNGTRNIPTSALYSFAEHFNIDRNYFHDENHELEFSIDEHTDQMSGKIEATDINLKLDQTIKDFEYQLVKQRYVIDDDQIKMVIEQKNKLYDELKGIALAKKERIISSWLTILFEQIEKQYQIKSENDNLQKGTSNNIELPEKLIQSYENSIEDKNALIELLKKANAKLEEELNTKK